MFLYLPIKESFFSSEVGEYVSYGIRVLDSEGNEIERISDVSLNQSIVTELCEKCTKYQLDVIHMYDVIEDNL